MRVFGPSLTVDITSINLSAWNFTLPVCMERQYCYTFRKFEADILTLKTIILNSSKGEIQAQKTCCCKFVFLNIMKDIFYPFKSSVSNLYDLINTVTNQCWRLHNHDHGVEDRRLLISLPVSMCVCNTASWMYSTDELNVECITMM